MWTDSVLYSSRNVQGSESTHDDTRVDNLHKFPKPQEK